tara:strand:- start:8 stop:220 length:213 start_codon:yes stop_codon:yes gene_type:complete
MTQKTLKVEGMTCQHCVQTINDALINRPGIETVEVLLDKKEVKIKYDEVKIKLEKIFSEIVSLGFEISKD